MFGPEFDSRRLQQRVEIPIIKLICPVPLFVIVLQKVELLMIPEKVKKRLTPYLQNITDDCIIYHSLDNNGYGDVQYRVEGKKVHYRAHRASFELANNCTLQTSDVIMHSCDTPACINPRHLSKGTHADNQHDKVAKNRQAKGTSNGRYLHGKYSKFDPVRIEPPFESLCRRSLSLEIVKALKSRIATGGCKLKDLADEFGIEYQTVRDISAGRTYKNI